MPTAVEESIVANVITTLQGINGAGGGYSFTMGQVVDYEAWDDDLLKWPAAMVLVTGTNEDDRLFTDRQNVDLEFMVVALLNTWDQATVRSQVAQILADVKKAMLADVTRGGYARDTHCTRTSRFIYDVVGGARAGGALFFSVDYRHVRGDPYMQG